MAADRWLKQWSSHFLDNLSERLICAPEKFRVSSTGLEPLTSAMPVHIEHMCSCERNDEWKFAKCCWEMNWTNDPHNFWTISGFFSHMSPALTSQRSWVRIQLKTPENFQVDKWDDCWDNTKVWGSLLQFITKNNRQSNTSFWRRANAGNVGFLSLSRWKFNLYQLAW